MGFLKVLGLATLLSTTVLAQAPKIRYMPFGDSITEIVCWRGLLQTQLAATGYTNIDFVGSGTQQSEAGCANSNYDRDNEGHSGFLAINIANRNQLVDWLKKNPADVITMHLGTNDIVQQNKKTEDIIAAFSTLVDQMRASNPAMKIIVAQIIPIAFGNYNPAIQTFNKAIPAWAVSKNTTASPIWVVDQFTGFSEITDLRDGVHPNAKGDAKMAAIWAPALSHAFDLMGEKATKREVEFMA
ncbi:SGNH hydrolase-type esterase domain-containing protein [Amylocarpus encephaloides]|uniref:SGNH hydrolase-type esterase domain-containing protein n=1 Tax=Amylocarpus encephaloides TaxID=45428 RepID=A0A9P7Y8A8_9HELO|nr:SGNH hydrolase-type esterase domain-containing protein [Amylocarpus encephaloides]